MLGTNTNSFKVHCTKLQDVLRWASMNQTAWKRTDSVDCMATPLVTEAWGLHTIPDDGYLKLPKREIILALIFKVLQLRTT